MKLNEISPNKGSVRNTKRLGRGDASGQGSTSGRGHKGQRARSGGYHKVGFEGGQMPLARRLPKRGFCNIHTLKYLPVNLAMLSKLKDGTEVTPEFLFENKIVKKAGIGYSHSEYAGVKILGNGEVNVTLKIKNCKVSKTAKEKIEKAGGTIEVN
ncbi:50S ribosomal protein L15 [bacterium]|nr:50S ribosomal protein L15 [bacterium]